MNANGISNPSTKLLAIVLVLTSGCIPREDMGGRFPSFPVPERIEVFSLQSIPERKLCAIDGPGKPEDFIGMLSSRFPDGWFAPDAVSLASSFRIDLGQAEIHVMKNGLTISILSSGSERRLLAHDLADGEAEEIVQAACTTTWD